MDRAEAQLRQRKARDRALVLLLLGVALLLPPIGAFFQLDVAVFGVPFTLVYLFAVWALLILGAGLLARRLADSDDA